MFVVPLTEVVMSTEAHSEKITHMLIEEIEMSRKREDQPKCGAPYTPTTREFMHYIISRARLNFVGHVVLANRTNVCL